MVIARQFVEAAEAAVLAVSGMTAPSILGWLRLAVESVERGAAMRRPDEPCVAAEPGTAALGRASCARALGRDVEPPRRDVDRDAIALAHAGERTAGGGLRA